MKKVTIELSGFADRYELHDYLAEKMGFPDYYGHNLDALYDCLTDISVPTAVGIVLPFPLEDEAREEPGEADGMLRYLLKVRRTFADAEAGNPNLAVFDLIRGPRPVT